VLTDLGSCVHAGKLEIGKTFRVHFTWTYAHFKLTSKTGKPGSIEGGGLKASSSPPDSDFAKYDLFAFGRTIQEILAILESEFHERCYASYGFRFLHLIACFLLDGHNAVSTMPQTVIEKDGRRFIDDTALGYPVDLFGINKIKTATELLEKLSRFSRQYPWIDKTPELDPWHPKVINTGIGIAPYTRRVEEILRHPILIRLKRELQLGWIKEVFPNATHNRWSHTTGVYAAVLTYYQSLLSDPEVPTFRAMVEPEDLSHGIVAALLHDIGQTAFGHDVEEAYPELYQHEKVIERLLDEKFIGKPTLREALNQHWPKVDIQRVLGIIQHRHISDMEKPNKKLHTVDMVAADIIDGPIDADKFDYLQRDSLACGVPYGIGIDHKRFLKSLSVGIKISEKGRLSLAYKAKGIPAIESLLLARYQMFGAVYWHHTFRCIQAMLVHSVASIFGSKKGRKRNFTASISMLNRFFYERVVCGKSLQECIKISKGPLIQDIIKEVSPHPVNKIRILDFFWRLAYQKEDKPERLLLERLANRDLYKQVFEIKLGDLEGQVAYDAFQADLKPSNRKDLADRLVDTFLDKIQKKMIGFGPTASISEDEAREMVIVLRQKELPRIIIDFPMRGIPEETNFPPEISDPHRKYLASSAFGRKIRKDIFQTVKQLQVDRAAIRIFAAEELHDLIIRYLNYDDIWTCVQHVIPKIKV
jgi:HD superfamily phosphohydrolase